MTEPEHPQPQFHVDASGVVRRMIIGVHRQAVKEGRGNSVVVAYREIVQRLQQDPRELGEPAYRLAGLQLEVRTCVVRPLVVDFAVHEEKPVVLIKGVKLLSAR